MLLRNRGSEGGPSTYDRLYDLDMDRIRSPSGKSVPMKVTSYIYRQFFILLCPMAETDPLEHHTPSVKSSTQIAT